MLQVDMDDRSSRREKTVTIAAAVTRLLTPGEELAEFTFYTCTLWNHGVTDVRESWY